MEEVDGIIIRNLRSLGCDIDEDVRSLKQFSTDLVIEATARCLHTIDSTLDVHHRLPPSMAAQFRIGTSLATAVQGLGYRGDIGYHTFLYSNDVELRRVLMFLVDRLPKDHSGSADQSVGTSASLLQKRIAAEVAKRMSQLWVPAFLRKKTSRAMMPFETCRLSLPGNDVFGSISPSKEMKQYCSTLLPYVSEQPMKAEQLPAAVFEANALSCAVSHSNEIDWSQQAPAAKRSRQELEAKKRERMKQKIATQLRLYAGQTRSPGVDELQRPNSAVADQKKLSRFAHVERRQFAPDEEALLSKLEASSVVASSGSEAEQEKREKEVTSLQESLYKLSSQIEDMTATTKNLSLGIQHITEQVKDLQVTNSEKEETLRLRKATLDLLPDAANNISQLEAVAAASSKRLVNLASQWEKHRVPLIEQYRTLKDSAAGAVQNTEKQLEDLKELQSKLKTISAEARDKDVLYNQLVAEYEQMAKDINRSAYTQRILEIVSNIRKQNQDIDKVLVDTKAVQKEINLLMGKLDRIFAVTDELIFRDAKKDDAVRKAYKYLASFHENCSLLIKTVEESGVIMREIRDLEDQLELEDTKKLEANLERITTDYQQMKTENSALIGKLKQQTSAGSS